MKYLCLTALNVRYQGGTHLFVAIVLPWNLIKETERKLLRVFATVILPHKSTIISKFQIFVSD